MNTTSAASVYKTSKVQNEPNLLARSIPNLMVVPRKNIIHGKTITL